VSDALRDVRVTDITWSLSTDAAADLASTRSQLHDLVVAPAHVVGSALRHGYVPLAGDPQAVQAVLVTLKDMGITSLAGARGKRLGLPLADSVVTYLLRGEFNAANTSLKSHFRSVKNLRYQDALLVCLQIHECDVVGVMPWPMEGRRRARGDGAAKPAGARFVSACARPWPAAAAALQPTLLRDMAAPAVARQGVAQAVAITPAAFDYVSTLGYFTPRQLPGATVVDAAVVARLLQAGAVFVDTRNETEFKAGRVPQARWVPYAEKSAKDTDFDAAADSFDLAKLPADKAVPLVFACNGPECWKSYKAPCCHQGQLHQRYCSRTMAHMLPLAD
jgi:rhodanese-related sulfurtransferase